ncbi:uncharacterized protein EAE97_011664 [Botrytis byssoidea]|uniref:Uncharacterized protein n=1 Tax=Botrytis byssoidea TaxID=139641 RepID=A0A9P5HVI6_9HELO|nr:uncharacterized protein EAE97_011664 [Botrytis byssoidea]KAF7919332.1 hypothetical protein EAE97_011664 [Botrytis byssoidea]
MADIIPPISSRMSNIIQALLPAATAAAADHAEPNPDFINFSVSNNNLLRPDLIEICKDAIAHDLIAETLNCPVGLGGDPSLMKSISKFLNKYFIPAIPITSVYLVTAWGAGFCLDTIASCISWALICTVMLVSQWFQHIQAYCLQL